MTRSPPASSRDVSSTRSGLRSQPTGGPIVEHFFEPLGAGRFRATELTRGPWDVDAQHAGPPAALLGRTLEQALGQPVARITLEILRPVPIGELTVSAEVVRPGRSVQLAQGELGDDDGPILLARAWSIRTADLDLPAVVTPAPTGLAGPADASPAPFFPVPWDVGYHTAMEVRFLAGSFVEPGPATAWMRSRVPVVAGTTLTPLERVLVGADSGNGLSATLDFDRWLFINTDLTVHLHRQPAGEWVCFDANTVAGSNGVGLATTEISDEEGALGRGLQSLLVAPR